MKQESWKEELKGIIVSFVEGLGDLIRSKTGSHIWASIPIDRAKRLQAAQNTVAAYRELFTLHIYKYMQLRAEHDRPTVLEIREETNRLFKEHHRDLIDYLDRLNFDADKSLKELREREIEIPHLLEYDLEKLSKLTLEQLIEDWLKK